jgi:hypothetical protein
MAKRNTAEAKEIPNTTIVEDDTPLTPEGDSAKQWTLPERHGRHSIDLGDGRLLRLTLNRRFNQNLIQFVATREGVDPKPSAGDNEYLRAHGWGWRKEETGRTKQLLSADDKAAVQAVFEKDGQLPANMERAKRRGTNDRQAEDEFVELANRIRERNGLPPVGYSLKQEPGRQ